MALDGAVVGGEPFGAGEAEEGVVGVFGEALGGAFAEGGLADDGGEFVVLERAGEDFGGGGGAGVDEDGDFGASEAAVAAGFEGFDLAFGIL